MVNNHPYLSYVVGDATEPPGQEPRIIAHVCNDAGGWGKGFVLALSKKWKEPEVVYRAWNRPGVLRLGRIQRVMVEENLWVVNMVAQHGYARAGDRVPLDYFALETCLNKLAIQARFLKASVHMPRIGTGLGGGSWPRIKDIIVETLCNKRIDVTIYDLASK